MKNPTARIGYDGLIVLLYSEINEMVKSLPIYPLLNFTLNRGLDLMTSEGNPKLWLH